MLLKELSIKMAHNLGSKLQTYDDIEVYAYGLEILLYSLINLIVLFSLAVVSNLLLPVLLVFIAWICFRIPGGGTHMTSYRHCLCTGVIAVLILARLSLINTPIYLQSVLLILTSFLALICIILWVPAGTSKKQILTKENRTKQKRETTITFLLWFISIISLMILGYGQSALALVLGAFGGLYAITPVGYRSLGWLDHNISIIERRVGICSEK